MKSLKKLFFCSIALALAAPLAVPASANDISQDTLIERQSFDEFVTEALPKHLNGRGIVSTGALTYSTPIALYDFENFDLIGTEIIVFEDGEFLGKMEIHERNNGYVSIFDDYLPDDICDALVEGADIAFGFVNDNLLFYSSEEGYVLADGFNEYEKPEINPITTPLYFDTEFNMPMQHDVNSITTVELDVDRVPNETIDGSGKCVFSCAAMLLNYHGCTQNLTTAKAYNKGKELVPNGSDSSRITKLFDYYDYDVTTVKTAISASRVAVELRNDNPLMIAIGKNGTASHEVVISGVTLDATSTRFTIVNPNATSVHDMYISHSNPNEVVSTISYGSYNYWKSVRY